MGRNALFLFHSLYFIATAVCIYIDIYRRNYVGSMSRVDDEKIARVMSALEIVLIRDGFLMDPDCVIMTADNPNGLLM
jgi:hypothetical protein